MLTYPVAMSLTAAAEASNCPNDSAAVSQEKSAFTRRVTKDEDFQEDNGKATASGVETEDPSKTCCPSGGSRYAHHDDSAKEGANGTPMMTNVRIKSRGPEMTVDLEDDLDLSVNMDMIIENDDPLMKGIHLDDDEPLPLHAPSPSFYTRNSNATSRIAWKPPAPRGNFGSDSNAKAAPKPLSATQTLSHEQRVALPQPTPSPTGPMSMVMAYQRQTHDKVHPRGGVNSRKRKESPNVVDSHATKASTAITPLSKPALSKKAKTCDPSKPNAPAPTPTAYPYSHYAAHYPYYYPYYHPPPSAPYHWPYPPPHAYAHYYPPPPHYYGSTPATGGAPVVPGTMSAAPATAAMRAPVSTGANAATPSPTMPSAAEAMPGQGATPTSLPYPSSVTASVTSSANVASKETSRVGHVSASKTGPTSSAPSKAKASSSASSKKNERAFSAPLQPPNNPPPTAYPYPHHPPNPHYPYSHHPHPHHTALPRVHHPPHPHTVYTAPPPQRLSEQQVKKHCTMPPLPRSTKPDSFKATSASTMISKRSPTANESDELSTTPPQPTSSPPETRNASDEASCKSIVRRTRKNAQSRLRAAKLKDEIARIKATKPSERTAEENAKLAVYEERRLRKNGRSRERAMERKAEFDRISSKEKHEWTEEERKFMDNTIVAKYKKNEGDRVRRKQMKDQDSIYSCGISRSMSNMCGDESISSHGCKSAPNRRGRPIGLPTSVSTSSGGARAVAHNSHYEQESSCTSTNQSYPHSQNEYGQSHDRPRQYDTSSRAENKDSEPFSLHPPLTPVYREDNDTTLELPPHMFAASPGAGLSASIERIDGDMDVSDDDDPMSHFIFPSPTPHGHESHYSPTLELSAGASVLDQSLDEIAYSPNVTRDETKNGSGNRNHIFPHLTSPINLSPLDLPRRSKPTDEGSLYDAFVSDWHRDDDKGLGRQDAIAVSFSVDTM